MGPEGNTLVNSPIFNFQQGSTHSSLSYCRKVKRKELKVNISRFFLNENLLLIVCNNLERQIICNGWLHNFRSCPFGWCISQIYILIMMWKKAQRDKWLYTEISFSQFLQTISFQHESSSSERDPQQPGRTRYSWKRSCRSLKLYSIHSLDLKDVESSLLKQVTYSGVKYTHTQKE